MSLMSFLTFPLFRKPQGSYFAWKAAAIGKNMVNAKTFLEKRYNDELELEDAVHTAILTLKVKMELELGLRLSLELGLRLGLGLKAKGHVSELLGTEGDTWHENERLSVNGKMRHANGRRRQAQRVIGTCQAQAIAQQHGPKERQVYLILEQDVIKRCCAAGRRGQLYCLRGLWRDRDT